MHDLYLRSAYVFADPCQQPGVCGMNALCRVENHRAACYCLPGFSGNPRDSVRGCTRGKILL